jgi:L-amino acid N-acyltransferase YncA
MALAAEVIGAERAGAFVRSHAERHHLLVAEEAGEVAGFLAYRTDWFQEISPSPRVFSSTEETNAISIRMHAALGFVPSGYIDNLPQGYRELLFYKRLRPAADSR